MGVSAVKDVTTARAPAPAPIDATGFDEVYQAHYASLVRLAYVTTGNLPAAEDLVQEAFAEYYRRRDEVAAPVPYLRRAVISRCTSWLRRRMLERRRQHTAALWPPHGDHPLGPDATAVRAALSPPAAPAAGRGVPALLPRPARGGHRRGAGVPARHGQVAAEPGAGRP